MNRKQRRAQASRQRARRVDAGPVSDPALLAKLVELGLLTPADAESLSEPTPIPVER